MINFISKVFILFFIFTSSTLSEKIEKIEINGNKRISNETILVLGAIKIGEDFTSNNLNESLKKLYETNFFSDIELILENGLLKIQLDENPIIEKINIQGIKKNLLWNKFMSQFL